MDDFRRGILKDVRRIQEEMDLLFDHFYKLKHSPVLTSRRVWRPPTDVYRTEEGISIRMEIAGMNQSDLNVTLSDQELVIRGERREQPSSPGITYQNMEINYGPFERNIHLSEPLDTDNIKAAYKDGFLDIRIPRRQGNAAESKEIKIEIE